MFQLSTGPYSIRLTYDRLPHTYGEASRRAKIHDEIGVEDPSAGTLFCVEVAHGHGWPFLVVAQRYAPSDECFFPGLFFAPETHRLYIGAGTRLLAYDLRTPQRLWEDSTEPGFWTWARYEDVVIMSAELEIAAWDLEGGKLWSRPVEPPWEYEVRDGIVHLDVMGKVTEFTLHTGRVTRE
ncbi:MAG: hypothetical protein KC657_31625 [Myxococcales bacterium]|nr:hypothetical protein [Myxococcales bacterium]